MPIENPQYDVAISFLSEDEAIAAAIYQKLTEGLQVFFFPRNQENLAGTDGLTSMREPFFANSRVMVVLYREPWGKTPWTRIEETAIKEACLEYGWERLFFVVVDRSSILPVWLPKNNIRFNYADFGLEQAVGAIKARVQENGGQHLPLTAMKRAEILKAEELFRRDKSRMNSPEGIEKILDSVDELFRHIEKQCADIKERGHLQIRYGADFDRRVCNMTDERVGLSVAWYQQYSNVLDNSSLIISEYSGGLNVPGEKEIRMYINSPQKLYEIKYIPDLSLTREYGWNKVNSTEFLSSFALAEKCLIRFIDLVNRYGRGDIKNRMSY
jgi:hypothetical protein